MRVLEGVEYVEEPGFVHIDFDGDFDCVSSAPGGGILRGISRISFGDYEDCDLALPCARSDSVRTASGEFGRTRVFAAAFSDLRDGLARAGEDCARGGGMTHVLLVLDCGTPDYGMLRATVTANEAVTTVVQDLLLRSDDGVHAASGSVCQSITVVRRNDSPLVLNGTGKHSKLGQLIGTAVRRAVLDSASANGVFAGIDADAMVMLGRYGYDSEALFRMSGCRDLNAFSVSLDRMSMEPKVAAAVSAALFVSDEMDWGLVPEDDGRCVIEGLLSEMFGYGDKVGDPVRAVADALAAAAADRI